MLSDILEYKTGNLNATFKFYTYVSPNLSKPKKWGEPQKIINKKLRFFTFFEST